MSPMLVTGEPLIVSGMVTAEFVPVYPVMVMVPLLVVKVNCPRTAAGSVNSSKSAKEIEE